jgi:SAM-dependent methyltransferase
MSASARQSTAALPGQDPWGARARDWAEIEDENSRPLFEQVFDLVGLGRRAQLLDVGCGSGLACAIATGRGAEAAGLDASPGLLRIAKERVPGGDFRAGDMGALPFEDASFDVVTFFNSYFFAQDQPAAMREARRVVRSGAEVAVVAWTSPDRVALSAYVQAVVALMPEPPDIDPFLGPARLGALAEQAGLRPDRSLELDWSWQYPDLDTALRGLMSPGLSRLAVETAGEDAVKRALRDALQPMRTASGAYKVTNTVNCLLAKA